MNVEKLDFIFGFLTYVNIMLYVWFTNLITYFLFVCRRCLPDFLHKFFMNYIAHGFIKCKYMQISLCPIFFGFFEVCLWKMSLILHFKARWHALLLQWLQNNTYFSYYNLNGYICAFDNFPIDAKLWNLIALKQLLE